MAIPLFNPIELEETDCCVCGVVFALPSHLLDHARRKAATIYCPNGHALTWKKSEAQELREQLDAETKRKQAALVRANEAEQARAKAEQVLGRWKKRTHAGVCPCCHRTFANVQRHMATKHAKTKP